MADELGAYAMLIVKALLKGQQAQHQIHRVSNVAHAALPPRPNLRAHVLHGRDAGGVQTARHSQIGVRRINADKHVRTLRQEHSLDAREQLQEPRQVAQHIEQAHDREGLRRLPTLAAGCLHLRSRHAEEFRIGRKPAQGHNEVGTQRIARGFARQQTHSQRLLNTQTGS